MLSFNGSYQEWNSDDYRFLGCLVRPVYGERQEVPTTGELIDLGLSVKWASCNVGATMPEEAGGYYAWGETEEKNNYYRENYYDKYSDHDISGSKRFDVAQVRWGGKWRMPKESEIRELYTKCTWQWTTVNGVNGHKITGPNGNSIFLPASGMRENNQLISDGISGAYWSSTAKPVPEIYQSYSISFSDEGSKIIFQNVYLGLTVRPVSD